MVVKKDVRAPKHAEINVPNLQVMKALLSLKSRGYVSEQFSWQHYYYFLTDEGILFLRSYLHLPETVVPLTIAKAAAAAASRPERDERQNRSEGRRGGEYRREWNKSEAPAAAAH
jgi:small subunit ribosomal protein S10e